MAMLALLLCAQVAASPTSTVSPPGTPSGCEEVIAPDLPDVRNAGHSVAHHHNRLVVGVPYGGPFQIGVAPTGTALVYERRGGEWALEQLIAPNEPTFQFGHVVAIHGKTIVVGAVTVLGPLGLTSGVVYVYKRRGAAWLEDARLELGGLRLFLESVAVSGNAIIASDVTGVVHAFKREGGAWRPKGQLAASGVGPFSFFGGWLDLDGKSFIGGFGRIGPLIDPIPLSNSARIFEQRGNKWVEAYTLTPPDFSDEGTVVSMDGSIAAIAHRFSDVVARNAGAVYVFKKDNGAWVFEDRLSPSDAEEGDAFGSSLSVDGMTVAIGAPGKKAVYLFARQGGVWSERAKLTTSELGGFGFAVSNVATRIFVGSPSARTGTGNVSVFKKACVGRLAR